MKANRPRITRVLLLAVVAAGIFAQQIAAQRSGDGENWESIDALVASTPARRAAALKRLKLDTGDVHVAAMTITCGACDRAARQLDRSDANAVIVVAAPPRAAREWRAKLGLKRVEVRAVSDETIGDLGAVLLPTIIDVRGGRYVRARTVE